LPFGFLEKGRLQSAYTGTGGERKKKIAAIKTARAKPKKAMMVLM